MLGRAETVTSVGIADRRPVICASLAQLLAVEEALHFVGACPSPGGVISFVNARRPDILILEAQVDREGALGTLDALRTCIKPPSTIMLVDQEDQDFTSRAIRRGASGVMTTTAPFQELIDALRWAARGRTWLSATQLADLLAPDDHAEGAGQLALSSLTRRERDILALLVDGLGHAAIAKRLHLSTNTVRTHSQNLQKKLGVRSAIGAVSVAVAAGIHPS